MTGLDRGALKNAGRVNRVVSGPVFRGTENPSLGFDEAGRPSVRVDPNSFLRLGENGVTPNVGAGLRVERGRLEIDLERLFGEESPFRRLGDGRVELRLAASLQVTEGGSLAVQSAQAVADLTDSSTGTAGTTVAAVSGSGADTTINNNFATITADITALKDALRAVKQLQE